MENQKYNLFKCNDFVLDDDFKAWVTGANPEKDHLWEAWLISNPSVRVEAEMARNMLLAFKFKEKKVSVEELDHEWKRVETAMMKRHTYEHTEFAAPEKRAFPFLKILTAASVIAVVCFASYLFLLPGSIKNLAAVEKKTSNGQQLSIKLPDGTSVTLNAGSALSYPKQFDDTLREITLTGEAFFDVVRNEKAPFIIHTGEVTTRVLGTSFNIRAYPENKEVQVAVVTGKVKVKTGFKNDKNSVCLVKSEMVTVKKDEGELIVTDYDEKDQIGWKDGILYFEKSDLAASIRKLERWYGVSIHVAEGREMDPGWRFSGKFKNKPINYILDVMSYPHQFSYKIKNNTVTLQ